MIGYKSEYEQKLLKFYSRVVRCTQNECVDHGAMNNPNAKFCYIPRSFCINFFHPKKILVVSTNPGKMTKEEKLQYSKIHQPPNEITNKESIELVKTHVKICKEMFIGGINFDENRKSLGFHRDLMEAVAWVLGIEKSEVLDYVNYTSIIKCQTHPPYSYLKPKNRKFLAENCFNRFLRDEIDLLKPELILTYGQDVFKYFHLHDLIPIKVFQLPNTWFGASLVQKKQWRDMLDVKKNNLDLIIEKIKQEYKEEGLIY